MTEMVTVEDVGMYHYQKSEKKARNVCWPEHEGDINECCTWFYVSKLKTLPVCYLEYVSFNI